MSTALRGAVLGIDTASPVVGAALWIDGRPGPAWSQRVVRGADAVLLPAVYALLSQLEQPLVRVAVTVGPGAFTGLRVGVATALGIAVARAVPVVPVGSLVARAGLVDGPRILALLDARKGRVYAGTFAVVDGRPRALAAPSDASLDALLPRPPFVAIGEGAAAFDAAIRAHGGLVQSQAGRSAAPVVARLGAEGPGMDPGDVALRYLRPADAVPPRNLGQRVGRPSSH